MTAFDFGEVVLVPFPFTDQTASKRRPAVVVSSAGFHKHHINLIVMPVTSQVTAAHFGEVEITEWKKAGLVKESVVKPVIATLEKRLVIRSLGTLEAEDQTALRDGIKLLFG